MLHSRGLPQTSHIEAVSRSILDFWIWQCDSSFSRFINEKLDGRLSVLCFLRENKIPSKGRSICGTIGTVFTHDLPYLKMALWGKSVARKSRESTMCICLQEDHAFWWLRNTQRFCYLGWFKERFFHCQLLPCEGNPPISHFSSSSGEICVILSLFFSYCGNCSPNLPPSCSIFGDPTNPVSSFETETEGSKSGACSSRWTFVLANSPSQNTGKYGFVIFTKPN